LTIVLVLADYSRYAQVRSCGRIDAQPSHSSERRVTASGGGDVDRALSKMRGKVSRSPDGPELYDWEAARPVKVVL
jgi:hypothetical protein